jgi:hypothetical protein
LTTNHIRSRSHPHQKKHIKSRDSFPVVQNPKRAKISSAPKDLIKISLFSCPVVQNPKKVRFAAADISPCYFRFRY